MNQQNHDEFFKHLIGLQEALQGHPLSEMQIEFYWRALEKYPWESVKAAIDEAAQTCRFFPKPVEIREIIEGGGLEDQAQLIWQSLIKCLSDHAHWDTVEFPEEVAVAIDTQFGGWLALSGMTFEELKWKQKPFCDYMRIILRRGVSGKTKLLSGQHDIMNVEKGIMGRQEPVHFLAYCPEHLRLPVSDMKRIASPKKMDK